MIASTLWLVKGKVVTQDEALRGPGLAWSEVRSTKSCKKKKTPRIRLTDVEIQGMFHQ